MRLTKFTHACVRVDHAGGSLVIDPGSFSEREAVDGASAVLVTHLHPDHLDVEHLRACQASVWTIAEVAEEIARQAPELAERVRVVAPGESFDAGVAVRAVGEDHAVIHPELPRVHNSGYVVEVEGLRIYHPGDALTLPGETVDLALVPVSAPWLKVSEAIDFARDLGAPRSVAIHDAIYSEVGLGIVDGHLERFLAPREQAYERVRPGSEVALG